MNSLTVGQQSPSKHRFWWLSLLVIPLCALALPIAGALIGAQGVGWVVLDALAVPVALLALASAPVVRDMPPVRRAGWTLLGAVLATAVGTLLATAGIFGFLVIACHDGCVL